MGSGEGGEWGNKQLSQVSSGESGWNQIGTHSSSIGKPFQLPPFGMLP